MTIIWAFIVIICALLIVIKDYHYHVIIEKDIQKKYVFLYHVKKQEGLSCIPNDIKDFIKPIHRNERFVLNQQSI